jgi:hypothetical protein
VAHEQLATEAIKLALQFIGALLVARLAVKWALRRFKSEKTWERRLAAYSDVIAAVGEMRLVTDEWYDDSLVRRERPEEYDRERRQRYANARRRLEEAAAMAELLLPRGTAETLGDLLKELYSSSEVATYEERLDNQGYALKVAQRALVTQGKAALSEA